MEPDVTETNKQDMSTMANAGCARDDSTTSTRLLDKHWSPLIVRKYQMEKWPMYVGMICDANLTDKIAEHYDEVKKGVTEGVIVCWYVDKMFCSSASGDFMTHGKCALEFYSILQMLPHI